MIARKGDILCCTEGHPVLEVTRDIEAGDTVRAEAFIKLEYYVGKVSPYEKINPKCRCGAYWISTRNGEYLLLNVKHALFEITKEPDDGYYSFNYCGDQCFRFKSEDVEKIINALDDASCNGAPWPIYDISDR